ncbi:hypothetical protein [Pelagicoccus sp. SDUM812003]|uniref:hypothetical protein n=1 Tax=Pelagicoccus sp. SDUM812003 TaxID=3041267 RepID=UPI00280DB92D|nr:hypothetical protein [Pelagicoccus sp. SDUM812003]MDQ8202305.1 hypothetical protein [Pelagicoccus sp. SDUM812003]
MRQSTCPTRAISGAIICFVLSGAAPLFATEPDPWFTQERDSSGGEQEKASTYSLSAKSPRAMLKRIMEAYERTPDSNLTRRISLLEEATATLPDRTEEQRQTLAELRNIQQGIERVLDQLYDNSLEPSEGLSALAPYVPYLKGDSGLLVRLLDSPFAQRLGDYARAYSRNDRIDDLRQLQTAVEEAGLKDILGSRVAESVNLSLARQIKRDWQKATSQTAPLPGESYLIDTLLGLDETRLPISVSIPENVDEKLADNIRRSIASEWSEAFSLLEDTATGPEPALVLKIDAAPIRTEARESSQVVNSTIPGETIEETNPEFQALVAEYQKAAESYESAMQAYETNYERYLEQFEDGEYDRLQRDFEQAERNLRQTPMSLPGGMAPNPDYSRALAVYDQARSLALSVSPNTFPEPVQPTPHHLKILDELYLVPSTIVISEEADSYKYTAKKLAYRFETEARLSIEASHPAAASPTETVALRQDRIWTANEGVHPRDPSADQGSFSQERLDSALDIFTSEFGARCSEGLDALLDQLIASLSQPENYSENIASTLRYLALRASQEDAPTLRLSQQELLRLSALSKENGLSPERFRLACLKMVLEKGGFDPLADEQKLSESL